MNILIRVASVAPRRVLSTALWGAALVTMAMLLSAYIDALNVAVRRGEELRNSQRAQAANEREFAHATALQRGAM